jgi:undecaprenyl-diphosphatase
MLTESRLRLAEARTRLERHDALTPLREWLLELGEREIHLVERAWRGAERPAIRRAAVAISWLGNGLAYLPLAVILLLTVPGVVRPLIVACVCVLVTHLLYPWAKLACGRKRPCELRQELAPRLPLLDRHSFPSGHAMTLSAALVPLLAAHPVSWPTAAGAWLLMGWSRIACAHHYPSDVLAGGALGMLVAVPVTLLLG